MCLTLSLVSDVNAAFNACQTCIFVFSPSLKSLPEIDTSFLVFYKTVYVTSHSHLHTLQSSVVLCTGAHWQALSFGFSEQKQTD